MTTYGLNNNTGTTLYNSTNNFDKINKKITNAGNKAKDYYDQIKGANEILNGIRGWQNAQNGTDKINSLTQIISKFMK